MIKSFGFDQGKDTHCLIEVFIIYVELKIGWNNLLVFENDGEMDSVNGSDLTKLIGVGSSICFFVLFKSVDFNLELTIN